MENSKTFRMFEKISDIHTDLVELTDFESDGYCKIIIYDDVEKFSRRIRVIESESESESDMVSIKNTNPSYPDEIIITPRASAILAIILYS